MSFALAIHGGAGKLFSSLKPEKIKEYEQGLKAALDAGLAILKTGGSAVDAAEAAVIALEDCKLLNAGRGSVFNCEGKHEMEAAIMDGSTLECGSVSCVSDFKNPISLAKLVMKHSPHVYLVGEGADKFATEVEQEHGEKVERRDASWFYVGKRYQQWQEAIKTQSIALDHDIDVASDDEEEPDKETIPKDKTIINNKNNNNNNNNNNDDDEPVNVSGNNTKIGTVGAVALDIHGNVAAATSTGGLTNKKIGRVGDTPLIGCGTYANNETCAVSCTGHGETFIRHVTAHSVSCLMEFSDMSLSEAVQTVIKKRLPQNVGGLVAVSPNGDVELAYNSEGMFRGVADSNGRYELTLNI